MIAVVFALVLVAACCASFLCGVVYALSLYRDLDEEKNR